MQRAAEYLSDASRDEQVRKIVRGTVSTVQKMKLKEYGRNAYAAAFVLVSGAVVYFSAVSVGKVLKKRLKGKLSEWKNGKETAC